MWNPEIRGDEEDPVRSALAQAVGDASLCWNPPPGGVFMTHRAQEIVDGFMNWYFERERLKNLRISPTPYPVENPDEHV